MKKTILIFAVSRHPWIGGIYYRKNMIFSMLQSPLVRDTYRIVVITNESGREVFAVFGSLIQMEVCRDGAAVLEVLCKAALCCARYRVKYVFPLTPVRLLSLLGITPVSWIADFQHNHYPEFFPERELEQRERGCRRIARAGNPLVLSSETCREDFAAFYGGGRKNVFVIHFVSYIEEELKRISPGMETDILKKYNLCGERYLCISNQFWKHKNHRVVFEAIRLLAGSRTELPLFVFTGEPKDRRDEAYYRTMEGYLKDPVIAAHVKVLGFIDRTEQLAIMKNALFLIQPSLFEGWGTVLEDAKVLGKRVVLSDIPVHREQRNGNCILFTPGDAEDLCAKMEAWLEENGRRGEDMEEGIRGMLRSAAAYSEGWEKILCGV